MMEAFGQESIANLMPLVVDVLENLDSSLSDNKVGGRVPRALSLSLSLSLSPSLPFSLSPSPSRPLPLSLSLSLSLSLTIRWVGVRRNVVVGGWVGEREGVGR